MVPGTCRKTHSDEERVSEWVSGRALGINCGGIYRNMDELLRNYIVLYWIVLYCIVLYCIVVCVFFFFFIFIFFICLFVFCHNVQWLSAIWCTRTRCRKSGPSSPKCRYPYKMSITYVHHSSKFIALLKTNGRHAGVNWCQNY